MTWSEMFTTEWLFEELERDHELGIKIPKKEVTKWLERFGSYDESGNWIPHTNKEGR